ncbi:hypothetical protein PAECIP111893_01569 [Paenibacillus plantiphilus]|uniref:DUF3221 domain-containing protein n=1 Tax=Paenibacillus plantiphilus TaxID=2905650 RepID=A0ABM9C364_9BACL|nr:YobA family protein [Paenibacillus plantiphilus]CAH1201307.1 hypothetical protein PAECIP111893_01569 [Paenibacillus plantiphilus]
MKKVMIVMLLVIAAAGIVRYSDKQYDPGNYIISKDSDDGRHRILVVRNVLEEDVNDRIRSGIWRDSEADLMWYHVEDYKLYKELEVGEQVVVKGKNSLTNEEGDYGYVMLSSPPQMIAGEIIRLSK